MESINRRSFLQKSVLTGIGMTLLSSTELNAGNEVKKAPITIPTGKRMARHPRTGQYIQGFDLDPEGKWEVTTVERRIKTGRDTSEKKEFRQFKVPAGTLAIRPAKTRTFWIASTDTRRIDVVEDAVIGPSFRWGGQLKSTGSVPEPL